jgi:hypothetical protein
VSLVAPDTIDVDGQIQLIDCDQQGQDAGPEADRVRQSRLNDVMIMVERERDALEAALAARLQRTTWPDGFAKLALTIDEQTPEFHIRITARPDHAIQVPSTKPEKSARNGNRDRNSECHQEPRSLDTARPRAPKRDGNFALNL